VGSGSNGRRIITGDDLWRAGYVLLIGVVIVGLLYVSYRDAPATPDMVSETA
jgi:hypothetical protein